MHLNKFVIIVIAILFSTDLTAQYSSVIKNGNEILELKNKVSVSEISGDTLKLKSTTSMSKKSTVLAVLYSLVIPGAGHLYLDRFDVGKYFFGVDVASWIGYGSLSFYGNDVITDAKTFSNEHAKVTDVDNKDDDYFSNVGNYSNIYEYNNAQLTFGNYSQLYNVSENYWNWDNTDNQNIFESQRKSSERIYNSRIIFGSILVANRVVCGISAYLLAKQRNKNSLAIDIQPEILMKKDYTFDGVKVNLIKNF